MKSAYYDIPSFNKLVSNSKLLKLFCLNVRIIKNKADKLNCLLESITHNSDILLYCETWLTMNDDPPLPPYSENYEYHGLVRTNSRGGGVTVYVKRCLAHELGQEFSQVTNNVESIMIRLEYVTIVLIYRPALGNKLMFFNFLEQLLHFLSLSSSPFVIMGDVNINILADDTSSKQLSGLINSFMCANVITESTRLTVQTCTLLDICITNIHPTDCVAGLLSAEISDHLPLFCFIPYVRKLGRKER